MGLNKRRRITTIFITFCLNIVGSLILFPRYKETFPLKPNINLQQLGKLYLYKHVWDVYIFLCTWSLQNLETLSEYSYFYGNVIICISSIRIFLLLTGHDWKHWLYYQTLTRMMYLRHTYVDIIVKKLRLTLWNQ